MFMIVAKKTLIIKHKQIKKIKHKLFYLCLMIVTKNYIFFKFFLFNLFDLFKHV